MAGALSITTTEKAARPLLGTGIRRVNGDKWSGPAGLGTTRPVDGRRQQRRHSGWRGHGIEHPAPSIDAH